MTPDTTLQAAELEGFRAPHADALAAGGAGVGDLPVAKDVLALVDVLVPFGGRRSGVVAEVAGAGLGSLVSHEKTVADAPRTAQGVTS